MNANEVKKGSTTHQTNTSEFMKRKKEGGSIVNLFKKQVLEFDDTA